MLELFGIDYIAEHILSEVKKENEDLRYKAYITDCLYYSGRNQSLATRYADLVLQPSQPKDKRTGEEIAVDLIKKLRKEE